LDALSRIVYRDIAQTRCTLRGGTRRAALISRVRIIVISRWFIEQHDISARASTYRTACG